MKNAFNKHTLTGLIIPYFKKLRSGETSEYKLVCSDGLEYYLLDSSCREIIKNSSWEVVKIIGLLNISNMTLIAQEVIPTDPTDALLDSTVMSAKNLWNRALGYISEVILIPIALCTIIYWL